MQKAFLFIFSSFIFIVNGTIAQSRLIWSSTSAMINSQITDPRSFAVDGAGNNYSVNFTQSGISLYTSFVFYAHDANGVKLWEYVNDSCLTDCNDKYFNIVPIENDGAIFIGAYDDITGTQIRLKRINGQGTLVWQQFWISPFVSVEPVKSILDNDGYLIVGISSVVNVLELEDFCVAKFDTAGGLMDWHIELPDDGTSSTPLSEVISGLTVDAGNNVYCVGTGSNGSTVKNYFFKIDNNGSLEYRHENTYDGINSSNHSIVTDASGNFYTLGFTGTSSQVEKYNDQSGSMIWSEAIQKDTAVLSNVGMVIDGNSIYVSNNFTYFNSGGFWNNKHYIVSKLNSSGTLIWQKDYFTEVDSLASQDGYGGAEQFGLCDGALYILSSQHQDLVNNILILHRTDLSGNTIWFDTASIYISPGFINFDQVCDIYLTRTMNNVNLTEKYSTTPLSTVNEIGALAEIEVYPNPSQGEFTINLKSDKIENAIAFVYNSIGEKVQHNFVAAGKTKISLSHFPSGIYFVQIVFNNNKKFTKLLLLE